MILTSFRCPLFFCGEGRGLRTFHGTDLAYFFLSVFPIEGHPNLDPFGQRVVCLFLAEKNKLGGKVLLGGSGRLELEGFN